MIYDLCISALCKQIIGHEGNGEKLQVIELVST